MEEILETLKQQAVSQLVESDLPDEDTVLVYYLTDNLLYPEFLYS